MAKKELSIYIAEWATDPVRFVYEAIGVGSKLCKCSPMCGIDDQQLIVLKGVGELVVAKEKKSQGIELSEMEKDIVNKLGISVKSGKGVGKTALLSWVILWFMTCFYFPKVICTAPKRELLRDNLWGEFSKWIRHSVECYGEGGSIVGNLFDLQSDKLIMKKEFIDIFNKDGKEGDVGGKIFNKGRETMKEWHCLSRTANINSGIDTIKQTMQGSHSPYMMLCSDEASGVNDLVFEPLETTLTQDVNFLFLIFNPNKNYGYAIDTHKKNKKHWLTYTINAEKSKLVTPEHIERLKDLYKNSPNLYRVNVLGEPPLSEEDALIPFEWIQEAKDNWGLEKDTRDISRRKGNWKLEKDGYSVYGIDVGGGGDKSVIVHRVNDRIESIYEKNTDDTMVIVSWICKLLNNDNPDTICIDKIGIGAGVYDRLRELGYTGLFGVNVGLQANNHEGFVMLRDEIFWRLRKRFEEGLITIPDDQELEVELATLRFKTDSGKVKVISKRDLKKSPNKADALSLTYYFENSTLRSRSRYNIIEEDDDDKYQLNDDIVCENSYMRV